MTLPSAFTGGCACGAVRYECSGAPAAMVSCHCRDCQRAGGSGYSPTVVVKREDFRVVGEPKWHEVIGESGATAKRVFCGECGSPLFASTSRRADVIGIRAGSLDDPSWFRPAAAFWTASAQPWDVVDAEAVHFPGNRR